MNKSALLKGGALIVALVGLGLLIAWALGAFKPKDDDKKCDNPSDDDKAAAGGDNVLTFKLDTDSGNCVANTCVSGLPPQDGICMAPVTDTTTPATTPVTTQPPPSSIQGCKISDLINSSGITNPPSELNNYCYGQYNNDNNVVLGDGKTCIIFPNDPSKRGQYKCMNGTFIKI